MAPCPNGPRGGLKFHLRKAVWAQAPPARRILVLSQEPTIVCPSGLRRWTQVPLAQAAWVQIPQLSVSFLLSRATSTTHNHTRHTNLSFSFSFLLLGFVSAHRQNVCAHMYLHI